MARVEKPVAGSCDPSLRAVAIHREPLDGYPNGAMLMADDSLLGIHSLSGDGAWDDPSERTDLDVTVVVGPTPHGQWLVFNVGGWPALAGD